MSYISAIPMSEYKELLYQRYKSMERSDIVTHPLRYG